MTRQYAPIVHVDISWWPLNMDDGVMDERMDKRVTEEGFNGEDLRGMSMYRANLE